MEVCSIFFGNDGAPLRWILIIMYWLACLALFIGGTLAMLMFYSGHPVQKRQRNVLRKIFHLLSVLLFLPVYYIDLSFLKCMLYLAFNAFLAIELMRLRAMRSRLFLRYSSCVTWYLHRFLPPDPASAVIWDPILLLFGISWPIWAVHSSSDIRGLSGLGSLGVGDAMASVVGVLMSNTEAQGKTFAGWAANFLSTFAFYTCLNEVACFFPVQSFISILVVSLTSSLVEAWVAINDNLVLPLVTFIAWQVQGTI